MNFRKVLGIPYDADERAVKRAYSALIKQYRPDTHPAEFAEVREAYEAAMQALRHRRQWEEEGEQDFTGTEPVAEAFAGASPAKVRTEARADQAFERVLTEPPVLAPPDAAPSGPPEFERVVTEPPVLPPFDVPPIEEMETSPVLGDAETLEAMLAEFEDHGGTASEDEQLQRYRAHARRLADWPLDFQMDYEQGLLSWLLFSGNPSLLVFQEADRRYDWDSASMDIMRGYGNGARQRYAGLQQLAGLFAAARMARNPFLLLEGAAHRRPIPIDDYYSALRAQEQSAAWQLACEQSGLRHLLPRLAYAQNRHWRVYWLDVIAGLLAAWITWLPLDIDPKPFMWLKVALAGVAALAVVVAARGLALWVRAKLNPLISRYQAWRTSFADRTSLIGQVWGIAWFVLLIVSASIIIHVMPALAGVIGVAVIAYVFSYFYRALTILEILATRMVIRLAHVAARLRRALAPS